MRQVFLIVVISFIISCSSTRTKMVGSLRYGTEYTYMIGRDSVRKLVRKDNITQAIIQELLTIKQLIKTSRKGRLMINAGKLDSIYIIKHKGEIAAYEFKPLTRYEEGTFYPKPCIELEDCNEDKQELYIIVGRKIYYDKSPDEYCNKIYLATEYDAEYEVLENIEGRFKKDTIIFKALSEGPLDLEYSEHALLFIENKCGRLQLVHRRYNNLYETTDGKWATPVNGYNYNYLLKNKGEIIQPVAIDYKEPIVFSLQYILPEDINKVYPAPFYEVKDSIAIAKYGYYLSELLTYRAKQKQ